MEGITPEGNNGIQSGMQNGVPGDLQEGQDIVRTARKHFSKLGLMFFIGSVIIFVLGMIVSFAGKRIKPEWLENADIALILNGAIMYLAGLPILILLVKRIPAVKVEQHHMKAGHFALSFLMSYAIGIAANFVGVIIAIVISMVKMLVFGGGDGVNNEMLDLISGSNILLMFVLAVCIAPVYEEYVFRKLIVERTVQYGQGVAVLLSGLMFGLFHGNFNQFIFAFPLGVFLAFLYAKTGKLKVTIAIHMIVNFIGSVILPCAMKLIDFDEYMKRYELYRELLPDRMNEASQLILGFFEEHWIGFLLYFALLGCIFCVVIAGIVLFIVFAAKRRFRFDRGEIQIPKGKRFSTVILNLGMILFLLYWCARIVVQLFA